METDNRLSYCRFCKNRLMDKDKGLICKLTGSKPDFQEKCLNFDKDFDEISKARKGIGAYRLKSSDSLEYILPEEIYTVNNRNKISNVNELLIYKNLFYSFYSYLLFFMAYILVLALSNYFKINIYISVGIFTVFLFYLIFKINRQYKKNHY